MASWKPPKKKAGSKFGAGSRPGSVNRCMDTRIRIKVSDPEHYFFLIPVQGFSFLPRQGDGLFKDFIVLFYIWIFSCSGRGIRDGTDASRISFLHQDSRVLCRCCCYPSTLCQKRSILCLCEIHTCVLLHISLYYLVCFNMFSMRHPNWFLKELVIAWSNSL
jgi:hypothetical protein